LGFFFDHHLIIGRDGVICPFEFLVGSFLVLGYDVGRGVVEYCTGVVMKEGRDDDDVFWVYVPLFIIV